MPKKSKSKPIQLKDKLENDILENKEKRKKIKVKIFETPKKKSKY